MTPATARFSRPPAGMGEAEFVSTFGGVYEHSPWIARGAWRQGVRDGHDAPEMLGRLLAAVVERASREQRLALIRAHPDLAGRAAERGELTAQSSGEQSSAGIDQCTPEELQRFQRFNDMYQTKFGFPFVMAVKGANRRLILAAFEQRLENDGETELEQSIGEIHKIARLRLEAMV
jgi:OHCU decarboxylase